MKLVETIAAFDKYLTGRGLRLEAVVVGGAALGLMGVISRQTKDFDILYPNLPSDITDAARTFAFVRKAAGEMLDEDWLNNGPSSLAEVLPKGWRKRLQAVYSGEAILLRSLGRLDLLRSKVFALCDRGIDFNDCIALKPTLRELNDIAPWLKEQDANPEWPDHVSQTLEHLQRELDNGV